MTLVIAGRDKYLAKASFPWSSDNVEETKINIQQDNGIFVVADSAISSTDSKNRLILNGFRKIYPIDIKLWQPYFIREYFKEYANVYYETECFVAVAGRTLTIQHVLNSITGHLSKLRISYIYNKKNDSGEYTMLLHCDKKNPLFEDWEWDEEMFVPEIHYADVYDASKILDFIEYSINIAIKNAKKNKLDKNEFNELLSEYIVGIYCNKTKKHLLTTFKIKPKRDDNTGIIEPFVDRKDIEEGNLAVIGMSKIFELKANQLYQNLLSDNDPKISKKMFEFLNNAIEEINGKGSKEIYFPSVYCCLDKNVFKKQVVYNPNKSGFSLK